ncbi:MAG: serine/threonine protein kinase [Wenzhouxiangella sp.]|nr:MAG: serine/threonine protein kinase [Wenzhouxiangella sp.]
MRDNIEEHWRRQSELFDQLAELPPGERNERLAAIAREDAELAAALERMFAADAASGVLDRSMEVIAPELTGKLDQDRTGTVVGRYRLLEVFGRGGMGEVWLARREDADGSGQQVALKILRRGMNSEDIVERFIQERRILASLEHPGIARFIDGGMTDDGLPYFVMERVKGLPITEHARQQALSVRQRMRLLLAVCDAVAYAQQRLVVHRDLKPGNVLVDETGRVRLLDFGIAKLLEDEPDSRVTATGLRAMSPAYAAPEQILGQTISTATDVYALGLLGYELLTDSLPHRRGSASMIELAGELSRDSIERPSLVIKRTTQPDLANARYRRELTRDLELVLLKALRPEPERRYPSAAALAADLRRWLDGEAVLAAGDSTPYRLKKFLGRYRGAVAATALVMLALAGGLAAALNQAEQARTQAAIAEHQAELARQQSARSLSMRDFLIAIFRQENPILRDFSGELTLAEAFDFAVEQVPKHFTEDPRIQAELLREFSTVLHGKGRADEAMALLEQAAGLLNRKDEQDPVLMARILIDQAAIEFGRGRQPAGQPYIERALVLMDERGADEPRLLAHILQARGGLASFSGEEEDSLRFYERALAIDLAHPPSTRLELAWSHFYVANTRLRLGLLEAAEPDLARAIELVTEAQGEQAPSLLRMLQSSSDLEYLRGRIAVSEAVNQRRLAIARAAFADDHPWIAEALMDSSRNAEMAGEMDHAIALQTEALVMLERLGHSRAVVAAARLGRLQGRHGQPANAKATLKPWLERCRDAEAGLGARCRAISATHIELLARSGQAEEALALTESVLAELADSGNPHELAQALDAAIAAKSSAGQADQELAYRQQLIDVLLSIHPADHPRVRAGLAACAGCQTAAAAPVGTAAP